MKTDNGLFICSCCERECDETEIKLDRNYKGELAYVCDECYEEEHPNEYTEDDKLWQYYEDIADERKCCDEE